MWATRFLRSNNGVLKKAIFGKNNFSDVNQSSIATSELVNRVSATWKYRCDNVFSDGLGVPTRSGKFLFATILGVSTFFGIDFAMDNDPQSFQKSMFYHLPYSALTIALWGGTFIGLEVAKYGYGSPQYRYLGGATRTALGLGLIFWSSHLLNVGMRDPWEGYKYAAATYPVVAGLDLLFHRAKLTPTYFFSWRLATHGMALATILFAFFKGQTIESNAEDIIMRTAQDALQMKETDAWTVPDWIKNTLVPVPTIVEPNAGREEKK